MRAQRILGMAAVILVLGSGVALAAGDDRLGTSGAPELRLPIGARNVGMSGANLGAVSGVESIFYNPAGIVGNDSPTEVMFSNTQFIADMAVNFVGVAQKMGNVGTVGLSAKVFSVGEIAFTSETAPDGTGEMFSPTFATLGLTYGRQMTDRVNFGGTVYYVAEKILQETASGVAFDFGFQYDTGFQGLMLGLAMKNFGPSLEFDGADFDQNIVLPGDDPQASPRTVGSGSAHFELPSNFQFGMSYPLMQGANSVMVHGLYQNNSYAMDDGRIGAEYMYRKDAALRLGYKYSGNEDDLFGLTYGAGVRVGLGSANLWVDYAGQQVSEFFDDVHHISLNLAF
ncbi:MAG TPA: PorV/PorQ family protein [Candidatus Eisenbacteria bacterium]|nr:PorV/PorQ family protein [Candidatus Eisenbacteria bacterium]